MEKNGELHAPAVGTHWIRRRVGDTARLDILEKREISYPAGIQTQDCPARSVVTISTEPSRFASTPDKLSYWQFVN